MARKIYKILSVSFIIIGILILCICIIIPKLKNNYQTKVVKMAVDNYIDYAVPLDDYYAILSIPKIDLYQEITQGNSSLTKGIVIHEASILPNKVIIYAHSGSGAYAYFKNLYKLNIGDEVYFYYENTQYKYVIEENDYQEKDGYLTLMDVDYQVLILITCTKNDSTHQTVYYAKTCQESVK